MKSKLFGLGAKMALALLAVGMTVTSCYDSENVDIVAPTQPEPASYVIVGNVTDGATGAAITTATYSIDNGNYVQVNGDGAFVIEDLTQGSHVVRVSAPTYTDAVRTIYLQATADGGVCIGNADFVLYTAEAGDGDLIYPDAGYEGDGTNPGVPATVADAEALLATVETSILNAFDGAANINMDEVTITVDPATGNTVLTAPAEVTTAVGEPRTVVLPTYDGFASSITPETDDIFATRALTDGQIWLASAEHALNLPYGLTATTRTYTIDGLAGQSISGYTLTILFMNRTLSFDGAEGTVMYQSTWTVEPTYESHDSHDSHDGHGTNNGAGGGNTNQGY